VSTLSRDGTALLVVDVQRGVVAQAHERDEVIGRIAQLVERARDSSVPVVWVQHDDDRLVRGSEDWEMVDELWPIEGEAVVAKHYGDSFEATRLEDELASRGVGHLVVAGAQTDACIRSTIHGAFVRGYDVTLVGDAHTTEDFTQWGMPPPEAVIAHTNGYWEDQDGPGRQAFVVKAADVAF
jgi:nicotinamidase-related amidase